MTDEMVREEDRATAAAKAEAEQMDRAYHPADVEPRIYERWLAAMCSHRTAGAHAPISLVPRS